MLYFYVNQSKNVGKLCLILWENVDIMIPADDKSPVCGEEGKLQIG